eukprot:4661048-Prymnesium_polylepis.1
MERRGVQKLPTVSSFSRQPRRVVRARRLEKRPFMQIPCVTPCLDARARGRAPWLESVSLCWTEV